MIPFSGWTLFFSKFGQGCLSYKRVGYVKVRTDGGPQYDDEF